MKRPNGVHKALHSFQLNDEDRAELKAYIEELEIDAELYKIYVSIDNSYKMRRRPDVRVFYGSNYTPKA